MISFRELQEINRHGVPKNATKAELKAIRSNPRSSKGAKQLAHWKLNMHHKESLDDWFNKEKWVRMDTKGNIKGDCAREPGEGKPKCLPKAKAQSMSKDDRAKAARRKRREDPQVDRPGTGNKPINVKTEEKMVSHEYSARMKKHGKMTDEQKAAVKAVYDIFEKCWDGWVKRGMKKKGNRMVPNCVKEDWLKGGIILEASKPNNPKLWSQAKAAARAKYDVYPSAYANGFAVKWYKKRGGTWRGKKD